MKVILAEKPSVARDIAKHLGANKKGSGFLEGEGWVVTWAFGHLVELKEPEEYNPEWKSWRLSSLPMIPPEFQLRARGENSAREQLETIKRLFNEAEELVCATDAGREGELIFRYIQSWSGCESKPFKRLWISSLTASAIAKGFKNLQEGQSFDNLYHAAKCRSEADWVVGLNSTRFFTVEYGKRNLLLSIGRVQTPILAMIVGRDTEIDKFVPENFWEVHTLCRDAKFKHSKGKIQKLEEAEQIKERAAGHELVITKVEKKKEKTNPLLLYDLTDLQRDMNTRNGFTADQTLKLAQNLYEKKFLTYPRTDSRYLSTDIKPTIAPLLEKLRKILPKAIAGLDLENLKFSKRIIDDAKVSDHHAIIPTDTIPSSDLPENEKLVYKAVALRLIAAFYPPCINAVTTVEAKANSEPFKARGTVLVDSGWQALYEKKSESTAAKKAVKKKAKFSIGPQILPDFKEGESNPHEVSVEKFKTSAPKRFTEASLLQLMETAGKIVTDEALKEALKDKGVGTPATRASIIEVLIQRKYIERKKKNLISTDDGKRLISLIKDERLKSPELTGDWEFRLKQMERGEYDPKKFMDEVEAYTREILSVTARSSVNLKNLGPCPCCDSPVIRGKTGYGCSAWKNGCRFVIWDGKTFGVNFTPELVAEFLLHKRTLTPHFVIDGEAKLFATLSLSNKGEISYEAAESETEPESNNQNSIGKCPVCSGNIVAGTKGYGCVNWRKGCKFVIWKQIARKEISVELATEILERQETAELEGFVSKAGKPFSAKLKVINGEVKLWFQ
ncbi:DNA topoisomerase 3 [Puniceicoccaceae bacterium K14]|nr:DNA topoisomerase 3 [Puniceicoccaceae bacterium K14]